MIMATSQKNRGKCYICKKEFTKAGMKKHLSICNNLGTGKTKYYLIKVEDYYDKSYWLYLQVKTNITLNELDDFLRDIWLECCGHLSSFTIDDVIYDKVFNEDDSFFFNDNEDMSDFRLIEVISKNSTFIHEYDFGSTTKLKLTVVDSYTGINSLEGIDLDVILIGEKTTGKNVGMEYEEYTVRNNTYRVVPITFQSYNAKGFGEYEKGFEPDILMDETNPYNEQGVFYIHKDYGNNEEPLYAKAIELITGTNPAPQTRSAVVNTLDGKTYKLPAIFRPGHDGMLMPARHAE